MKKFKLSLFCLLGAVVCALVSAPATVVAVLIAVSWFSGLFQVLPVE